MNNKKNIYYIIPFLVLVILFGILDDFAIYKEIPLMFKLNRGPSAIAYLSVFGLSILSLLILFFFRNNFIKITSLLVFFVSVSLELGYSALNGTGLGYEDILLLYQNVGFSLGGETFQTYFQEILKAASISFVLTSSLSIGIYKYKKISFSKKRYLLLPLICAFAVLFIFDYSILNRTSFPAPIKIPSLFYYASKNNLYSGARDQPYIQPITNPLAKHIVWIIDESIRGDLLQINGLAKETTPFLKSIESDILNLGTATSGAVCSDYSHIMLMSGIRPNQLPDKNGLSRKMPTIFQYAQKSGMTSNLIYCPGFKDHPSGYLTKNDFEIIENLKFTRKEYPDIKPHEIDLYSINFLENVIKTQGSSFTYFLKYGAHVHYESTYPPDKKFFTPTQDPKDLFEGSREEMLNSYYNALRWEVDAFYQEIVSRFKGQDVLIIYTSDHGQNLLDHETVKISHCATYNAIPQMAEVPIFILPLQDSLKDTLSNMMKYDNKNRISHFNIFPSTLIMMGYNKDQVKNYYEETIFDNLSKKKRFYTSGDIFGRGPFFINDYNPR